MPKLRNDWLLCNEFKRSLQISPLRGVNVVNFTTNLPYGAKKSKCIHPSLYNFVYVNSKNIAMETFTDTVICVTNLKLKISAVLRKVIKISSAMVDTGIK